MKKLNIYLESNNYFFNIINFVSRKVNNDKIIQIDHTVD